MQENTIQIPMFRGLKSRSFDKIHISSDVFKYNPLKKWKRVQRLCFYILRKIGCFHTYYENVVEVKTITIDKEKFIDQLMQQKAICYDWYQTAPTRLLIGSCTLHEWLGQPDLHQSIRFELQDALFMMREDERGGRHRRAFGLDVTIVPTMSGMIVLP